jgi:hypothetical protein
VSVNVCHYYLLQALIPLFEVNCEYHSYIVLLKGYLKNWKVREMSQICPFYCALGKRTFKHGNNMITVFSDFLAIFTNIRDYIVGFCSNIRWHNASCWKTSITSLWQVLGLILKLLPIILIILFCDFSTWRCWNSFLKKQDNYFLPNPTHFYYSQSSDPNSTIGLITLIIYWFI